MSACDPADKAARRCGSRRAEVAIFLRFDRWRLLKALLRLPEMPPRSETALPGPSLFHRTASTTGLSKTSSTNQDRHARLRWLASAGKAPWCFDRTAAQSAPLRPTLLARLSCYRPEHFDRAARHDNPCSYIS